MALMNSPVERVTGFGSVVMRARSPVISPASMVARVAASKRSAKATRSGSSSNSPRLRRAPGPGEDGGYGVRGGLLAFQMLVVVTLHRAVSRLVLVDAAGLTSTEVIMASDPKALDTMSLITSPS